MFKKKLDYYYQSKYKNNDKPTFKIKQNIDNIIYKNNEILKTKRNTGISDSEGLSRAYAADNRIYIDGNKMYVAGTEPSPIGSFKNAKNWIVDWTDNFIHIPTNTYESSFKYKNAEAVLNKNPQVDTLIGHSAGGSAVLELNQNNNNKYKTRTYSAPVFSLFKNNNEINDNNLRFRTQNDIVAYFDNNALTINKNSYNPLALHAFSNYGDLGSDTGKQIM